MLKIEPSEIISFFSTIFFPFGGGPFSVFPLEAPMYLSFEFNFARTLAYFSKRRMLPSCNKIKRFVKVRQNNPHQHAVTAGGTFLGIKIFLGMPYKGVTAK